MSAITRTLSPFWVKVAVPTALLPLVGCRVAFALGPPPGSIIAHPASRLATVAAPMAILISWSRWCSPAGSPILLFLGGGLGRSGQPSDPLVLAIVRSGSVLRLAEHLRVLLRRVVRLLLGLRLLCRIDRGRGQLRPYRARRRGHRHAHYQDPNIHGVSLSLNAEPAARPAGLRPLRP